MNVHIESVFVKTKKITKYKVINGGVIEVAEKVS